MGNAPVAQPSLRTRPHRPHDSCEAYAAIDPDAACGLPAQATVWVQCLVDGPRERGVCADHLVLLRAGVVFRCRHCSGDLNLLAAGG